MARIGLIDVDGHNFPNLALMKISAFHKSIGDHVEFYNPVTSGHMDKVYMSKVFSFTNDYEYFIDADEIQRGGTGYCISLSNGKEIFDTSKNNSLPNDVEHTFPDYSLYGVQGSYGFMSRGCPRQCSFCHVAKKEGCVSRKVADVSEFWNGQKEINLMDPNLLACKDWSEIVNQLIDTKSFVDINQGLDIRLMNEEKAEAISNVKANRLHFAWDRIEDESLVTKNFEFFRKRSKINERNLVVYVLCGDRSKDLLDSDIYRVEWLRSHGYAPYIMLYDKEHLEKGSDLRRYQRYVNNRFIFYSAKWEEYMKWTSQ